MFDNAREVPIERMLGALALVTFFFVPKSKKTSTLCLVALLPMTVVALVDGEPNSGVGGKRV